MSTTGGTPEGTILVLDEPAAIERKVRRAVTDSGTEIASSPDKPGVTNLIEIMAAVGGRTPAQIEAEMRSARGYGDLKAAAAAAVVEVLAPVRERYEALRPDEAGLDAVLAEGAEKARAMSAETLRHVRAAMGYGPPQ